MEDTRLALLDPLAQQDFNRQLSLDVLAVIRPLYDAQQLQGFEARMQTFATAQRGFLTELYRRYRDDQRRNVLLFQPEAVAILDLLERVPLAVIARIDAELAPLREQLAALARRQPGCRALDALYWAEMGDCRRFPSSRDAVRHTGLDVTVHSSDDQRTRGHLARQGPPVLRWALVEAAKCATRRTSPDHALYESVAVRIGANRATLTVARKLARRAHHVLRSLGDAALVAA